ncbi:hypothetical protein QRD02_10370 [Aequorivita sp. SDUM287046]|uniref:Glycine dehydrogenase n=1 Tax=Aequorivita aurantiaca TaxID=3053356 RepID=A0ABT8DHJ5_9FLAO|nr:hypothetical protein [Aequorivita aurantiaca]MDN3724788.1 hypothetical protein [Aequorivita aurantiaca]
MNIKFFLKCNKAAHLCDKSQYKETGFLEKLFLKLHILVCSLCRGHAKQNGKLTETIKAANLKTLRPEEKEILKKRLENEISRGH